MIPLEFTCTVVIYDLEHIYVYQATWFKMAPEMWRDDGAYSIQTKVLYHS